MNKNQTNEQKTTTGFAKLIYKGNGHIEFDFNNQSYAVSPNIKITLPTESSLVIALIAQGLLVHA